MKTPYLLLLIGVVLCVQTLSAQTGCMNPWACNYDETATTDDGSCDLESCFGCTVIDALNYDPTATRDDGSCDFTGLWGCTYPPGTVCEHGPDNYDPNALFDNGSCVWAETPCATDLVCDGNIDTQDLLQIIAEVGSQCPPFPSSIEVPESFAEWTNALPSPQPMLESDEFCNHPQACNYDPLAPDGNTCDWTSCAGCHYVWSCNYSGPTPSMYTNCTFDCGGCTYVTAINYNPDAQLDDGSCDFTLAFSNPCPTDFNGDGFTGVEDLLVVLADFGTTCTSQPI